MWEYSQPINQTNINYNHRSILCFIHQVAEILKRDIWCQWLVEKSHFSILLVGVHIDTGLFAGRFDRVHLKLQVAYAIVSDSPLCKKLS